MPAKPLLPKTKFIDPNNEHIRAIDQISFHPGRSDHIDVTCCAFVPFVEAEKTVLQTVVVARLRMSLGMARLFADGLTRQVAMVEAQHSTTN